MVGAQGFSGRGDVGNRLSGFVHYRAFGRALAVDQSVIGHACIGQKLTHQPVILGRNAQAVAMGLAKRRGRGIQIVQRVDIDPAGGVWQ